MRSPEPDSPARSTRRPAALADLPLASRLRRPRGGGPQEERARRFRRALSISGADARGDQGLMLIVARRFSGSLTPSGVATAFSLSPRQSTDRAPELTPAPTRPSAVDLARRSERRWLYSSEPERSAW